VAGPGQGFGEGRETLDRAGEGKGKKVQG
jgi:hypothetical protein